MSSQGGDIGNIKDPKMNIDPHATKIIQGVSDKTLSKGMLNDFMGGSKIGEFKHQEGMQNENDLMRETNSSQDKKN